MPKISRTKGAEFERWVARFFRLHGWTAKRTAPMQAGVASDYADLLVRGPAGFGYDVECKCGRQVPAFFYQALEQAKGDSTPVVVARGHRQRAIVVMYLDDWMEDTNGTI